MREIDEPPHEAERWAGSVVKVHVEMGYPEVGKVLRGVEFLVQADHEADFTGVKVVEDVFKGLVDVAGGDLGEGLWDGWLGLSCGGEFVLGGSKGKEVWCDPVEVTHVDSFVAFISEGGVR